MEKFFKNIFSLSRKTKRLIQIILDVTIIFFCFWIANTLRLGAFYNISPQQWGVLVIVATVAIFANIKLGLYRAVIRNISLSFGIHILKSVSLSTFLILLPTIFLDIGIPKTVPIIYFVFLMTLMFASRSAMKLLFYIQKDFNRTPVAVVGTGDVGKEVINSLLSSRNYRPSLLFSLKDSYKNEQIYNLQVEPIHKAKVLLAKENIKEILIGLDEQDQKHQDELINDLTSSGFTVRVAPSLDKLMTARRAVSSFKKVSVLDLVGRQVIEPVKELAQACVKDRVVLVTGAGGSIGSEICLQILKYEPKCLILVDHSEADLYRISEKISNDDEKYKRQKCRVIPVLTSVLESEKIQKLLKQYMVDTVYHAAAYKHVPIVEQNISQAIKNNVGGTKVMVDSAIECGVRNFTLVSSDKAVRPTNVMGATKRLCEIYLQIRSFSCGCMKLNAVRFGNVINSSGSVIPKFESQITKGGPITVTHPEIERFFMSIPEAAQLVLQASGLSDNGEIFTLDMGKPVKILDIAKKLCSIRGYNFYIENEPRPEDPSIQIIFTGLRKGEKLYEELHVSEKPFATQHPKIFLEKENIWQGKISETDINYLLQCTDDVEARDILLNLPLDYKPSEDKLM